MAYFVTGDGQLIDGRCSEVFAKHLPRRNPFIHRPFTPSTGGGEVKLQNFSQKGFLAPLSPSVFMHGIRYSLSALPYAVAIKTHGSPFRAQASRAIPES